MSFQALFNSTLGNLGAAAGIFKDQFSEKDDSSTKTKASAEASTQSAPESAQTAAPAAPEAGTVKNKDVIYHTKSGLPKKTATYHGITSAEYKRFQRYEKERLNKMNQNQEFKARAEMIKARDLAKEKTAGGVV